MLKFPARGIIVYILVLIFLYQDTIYAQVLPNFSSPKPILNDLYISEDLGRINKIWQAINPGTPTPDKTILHIQDSHTHYQAQKNIAGILEEVISKGRNKPILIAVEGAVRKIDTSVFWRIDDPEIKHTISDSLVKEGIMTGADLYTAYSNNKDYIYWGVEDKDMYLKNLECFRRLQDAKKGVNRYLAGLVKELDMRGRNRLNPEQFKYLKKINAFHNDQIGLEDYSGYLSKYITSGYSNFIYLLRLLELRKIIDFSMVDRERMELLKYLKPLLPEGRLVALITSGLEYQAGRCSSRLYYNKIRDFLPKDKRFLNLRLYTQYILLDSIIDRDSLFIEIDKIEKEILKRLFIEKEDLILAQRYIELMVIRKFLDLRIYRDDLDFFEKHRIDFNKYRLTYLDIFREFCQLAIQRDNILVDNTLAKMREIGTDTAIVITGGFHTSGISNLLQAQGISYAIISPKMTETVDRDRYITLMNTGYEKMLAFQGKKLAPYNKFCSVFGPPPVDVKSLYIREEKRRKQHEGRWFKNDLVKYTNIDSNNIENLVSGISNDEMLRLKTALDEINKWKFDRFKGKPILGLCEDCSLEVSKIFSMNGFPVSILANYFQYSMDKDYADRRYFNEINLDGKTFIIDISADQFEDENLGIVFIPKELIYLPRILFFIMGLQFYVRISRPVGGLVILR